MDLDCDKSLVVLNKPSGNLQYSLCSIFAALRVSKPLLIINKATIKNIGSNFVQAVFHWICSLSHNASSPAPNRAVKGLGNKCLTLASIVEFDGLLSAVVNWSKTSFIAASNFEGIEQHLLNQKVNAKLYFYFNFRLNFNSKG